MKPRYPRGVVPLLSAFALVSVAVIACFASAGMSLLLPVILLAVLGAIAMVVLLYRVGELAESLENARSELLASSNTAAVLQEEISVLRQLNARKDVSIGNDLCICFSRVADKERYRKGLLRLSAANRREELHSRLSQSDMDEDLYPVYANFDKTFLSLFPDFFNRFNSLLPENERIAMRQDGTLTSEMRVFAMMRLGISDIKQIATALHLSVATVYNYRSRYRNSITEATGDFEGSIRSL